MKSLIVIVAAGVRRSSVGLVICCLLLLTGYPRSATAADTVDISSFVSVSYTKVVTSYNPITRVYTSTHTATLVNTSTKTFSAPLHGVLVFNNLAGTPTVVGAQGGLAAPPYQNYYYDLGATLYAQSFTPGATVSVQVTIARKTGTLYSSTIIKPYGVVPAVNAPPTAFAGQPQTITLQPGQSTAAVTLSGSGSDSDGTIAGYSWSGTPDPADVQNPVLALGVGIHTFALVVTDDQGAQSEPAQVSVTVNPAPNLPPTADAGVPQTVTLQPGQSAAPVTLSGGGSDSDGSIAGYIWSGTPDPADVQNPTINLGVGSHTFTLVVTDNQGVQSAPAQVSITVLAPAGAPPVLDPIGAKSVAEGELLTFTVSGSDADLDPLTFSAGALPAGAAFSAATRTFTWTPGYDQAGVHPVTFSLSDGGSTAGETVQITVSNSNRKPALTEIPAKTVAEDATLAFALAGSDPDGDTLTFSAASLPSGASLDPVTGAFSWRPGFSQAGSYKLAFTVSDGTASESRSADLTVSDMNRDPAIVTQTLPPPRIDHPYGEAVAAVDPDGDTLTFTLTGAPAGMGIGAASGAIDWIPTIAAMGNSYPFTVSVSDGRGGSDSREYTLAIPDTVPPAVNLNAPREVVPGASFSVSAVATDNVAVTGLSIDSGSVTCSAVDNCRSELSASQAMAPGSVIVVLAEARDAAGNPGVGRAEIGIAAAPDTEPPAVSLSAPLSVTRGQRITLAATATDNQGVASLVFAEQGETIGTATPPSASVSYQVPPDAAVGSKIPFMVTATDFSNLTASALAESEVVESADDAPPVITLAAPATVIAGRILPVTLKVTDDRGVANVDLMLSHRKVSSFAKAVEQVIDLPVPSDTEAGTRLTVEVTATDASGNSSSSSVTTTVEVLQGLLTGAVYDDTTGAPLKGAEVLLDVSGRPALSAVTDAKGHYSFVTDEGSGSITVSKNGYSRVDRPRAAIVANAGRRVTDARLTPAAAAAGAVPSVLGGTVVSPFTGSGGGMTSSLPAAPPAGGSATLTIPAGSLAEDSAITLTQIGAQGLQGVLPAGWSPAAAFLVGPRGALFAEPASLVLPNLLQLPAGTSLPLVRWDESSGAWLGAGSATVGASGESLLAGIASAGEFAAVARDAGSEFAAPAEGAELSGTVRLTIPSEVAAFVLPKPKTIFYKPGVKSEVGTRLTAAAGLPSGTPILAEIVEAYDFFTGERMAGEPFVQDIFLYSFGREGVPPGADYFVSPTLDFAGLALNAGTIDVTQSAPLADADVVTVVGSAGGTFAAPGGEALTVPAGAVKGFVPLSLSTLRLDESGIPLPAGLDYVGGVVLGLAGNGFALPATLSVPLPAGFAAAGDLALVRALEANGETILVFVASATVESGRAVSRVDLLGNGLVKGPGVAVEGRYLFVDTRIAAGYAGGSVTGIDSAPFTGALVSSETLPLAALSGDAGRYVVPVAGAPFILTALDPVQQDRGSAAGSGTAGAFTSVDLFMKVEPPRVASVSPVAGGANVALADSVRVVFSEPILPASLAQQNFTLSAATGGVPVTLELSAGNTQVTLRHAEPFAPATLYTLTVQGVQDLSGNPMAAPFSATFTSLDTNPPPAPPAGSVNASIPGDGNTTTVTGTQGTAGVHDTVHIINLTTGQMSQVQVDPDGGFTATVPAGMKDRLAISITGPSGATTTVPLEGFRETREDGSVVGVVGPEGGRISAGNLFLDVPKDAFPDAAQVRFKPIAEADLGVTAPATFPMVTGFEIESSVVPSVYLNVSAPMPEGTDPRTNGVVVKVVDDMGNPAFSVVDTAKMIGGRLATSSPPCPGIVDRVGRYAMLLNDDQRMRYETVLATLYPPKYINYDVTIRPFFDDSIGAAGFMIPFFNFVVQVNQTPSAAYNTLCMPLPPNQKVVFVYQDARNGTVMKAIPIDNTSAGGSTITVTYVNPNDDNPPEITEITPENKSLSLANRSLVLRFSEMVSQKSLRDNVKIILASDYSLFATGSGPADKTYPYDAVFSENDTVATITPKQLLPMGKRYYLLLEGIADLKGNEIKLPYLEMFTSMPRMLFPAGANRFDKAKIGMDLGIAATSVGTIAFSDVDFFTAKASQSSDKKWHTSLLGLNGSYMNSMYRLFTIDASEPTEPKVLAVMGGSPKYALDVKYLKDVSFSTRSVSGSAGWSARKLYRLAATPASKVCADESTTEGTEKLTTWRSTRGCPYNSDGCDETVTTGCGDLAVLTGYDLTYSLIWMYDVTDLKIQYAGGRLLSDYGELMSYPRKRWAPAGHGMAKRFSLVNPMDIDHNGVANAGTMGAYVAVPGIGLELVDLGANIPAIEDYRERTLPYGTPLTINERLTLFNGTPYQDVKVIGNRVVAAAGDRLGGSGIQTLEIFDTLLSNTTSMLALPHMPNRLTVVENFLSYDEDGDGTAEGHDYAFTTGFDGGIAVATLPKDGSAPELVAFMKMPAGSVARHIEVDPVDKVAYVGVAYPDGTGQVHALLVADVSRIGTSAQVKVDSEGWDSRIVAKIPVKTPAAAGTVPITGFRIDRDRGLLYAGIDGTVGGDCLAVIRIHECADLGLDFHDASTPVPVPVEVEKKALQEYIAKGLAKAHADCRANPPNSSALTDMTILEQGSGACIWTGRCQGNYQPGISDHDYELFFPISTVSDTQQCVADAIAAQFKDPDTRELTEIVVDGYKLTFPDITFYPMSRPEFESAKINVNPPAPSTSGDAIGDMGLGRQTLLLKWLLEGAYVDLGSHWTTTNLAGKPLKEILGTLKTGTTEEPSGIKRLEGYEWAKLQESEIYASGVLIRFVGEEKPNTTLNHALDKDLHKAGKAGIRAVMARLVANKDANRMTLANASGNLFSDGLACLDASASYTPAEWVEEPCDSFEHFVASSAARITRDTGLGLFNTAEIKDTVYPFYRVKAGKELLDTAAKANTFIANALKFIQQVGNDSGEAKTVYDQTLYTDPDSSQRQLNMTSALDRITDAKPKGKKQIVPRLFNAGGKNSEPFKVRMHLPDPAVEESVTVSAGQAKLLGTKLVPDPADGTRNIEKKIFTISDIDQGSSSTASWVSFLADLGDKLNEEPERNNNWAKLYYYVLDPANPTVPTPSPATPTLPITDTDGKMLDPDNVCLIKQASIRIVQQFRLGGALLPDPFVFAGGDCGRVEFDVTNSSGQTLKDVQIYSALDKKNYTIDTIADGETKQFSFEYCPTKELTTVTSFFIPTANDSSGDATPLGVFAPAMEIPTRCPIRIETLDDDPNPDPSTVQFGGTVLRYYQVWDYRNSSTTGYGVPGQDITLNALFTPANGTRLIKKEYKTNKLGFVVLPGNGREDEEKPRGMEMPWDMWGDATLPGNPPAMKAKLGFKTLPDGICVVPGTARIDDGAVDFTVERNPLEVSGSLKAGTALDLSGSAGAQLSLGGGGSLELSWKGLRNGDPEEKLTELGVARSVNVNAGIGAGWASKFNVYYGADSINLKGPTAGVGAQLTVSQGDRYTFPLPLTNTTRVQAAGLLLDTLVSGQGSALGPAGSVFQKGLQMLNERVTNFAAAREGRSVGMAAEVSGSLALGKLSLRLPTFDNSLQLTLDVGSTGKAGFNVTVEDQEAKKAMASSIGFMAELALTANVKAGLSDRYYDVPVDDKGYPTDPPQPWNRALLKKWNDANLKSDFLGFLDNLAAGDMTLGTGATFKFTQKVDENMKPTELELTLNGKKNYGLRIMGNTFSDSGPGGKWNKTVTVTKQSSIVDVLKQLKLIYSITDTTAGYLSTVLPTAAPASTVIGPLMVLAEAGKVFEAAKEAEFSDTREAGNGVAVPIGLAVGLGAGIEAKFTLSADYADSISGQKGVIRNGVPYLLEDYSAVVIASPTLNRASDKVLDIMGVGSEVATGFHGVSYDAATNTWRSHGSALITLASGTDFALVDGIAAYDFDDIPGPVEPRPYLANDVQGAADKPHYGIGGFQAILPTDADLSAPATLVMNYHEDEAAGLDRSTLKLYRMEEASGEWVPVEGVHDQAAMTITASVSKLGLYSIAPPMPAGKIVWSLDGVQRENVGTDEETATATFSAAIPPQNDGAAVPAVTRFHVTSAEPASFSGGRAVPYGDVSSPDLDSETAGTQVVAGADGRLHLSVKYQGKALLARIISFSDIGTARGDQMIPLPEPAP